MMKLPSLTVDATDGDRGFTTEFKTAIYRTPDAAILRARADYFINILRSHRDVLDELVEMGAKSVAVGIRNEERAGKE